MTSTRFDDSFVIPEGVVGIAGFPAQFHHAERKRGPLPKTIVMRCPNCGHEVRLFRLPRSKQRRCKMSFQTIPGVEYMPPGTAIPCCLAGCSS